MSGNDSANNEKKPRATYSPLILLAIGIGAYAYYNFKEKTPETIPDMQLTQTASADTAQEQIEEGLEEGSAEPPAEESAEPATEDSAAATEEPKTEQEAKPADETAPAADVTESAKAEAPSLESMIAPRSLGSPDAPVKIVEHASFTCPHCAQFHSGSFKKLIADYVDTGKVQLIFVDYPFNRPAVDATVVARCIPEKNYFNFVRLLFETQSDWTSAQDYRKALKQHAMIAGLSSEAFDTCIDNEKLQEGILGKTQEYVQGKAINSVPTLVLNNEKIISGNVPYEEIKAAIDAELALSGKE